MGPRRARRRAALLTLACCLSSSRACCMRCSLCSMLAMLPCRRVRLSPMVSRFWLACWGPLVLMVVGPEGVWGLLVAGLMGGAMWGPSVAGVR